MTDLSRTIAPKSDQLNADDLIGRTMTIKVSRVSPMAEPDQPIAINFEGDGGKPYKPCKSMRRVLVTIWGGDGSAYTGRRMTLYRDDKVQFGGMAVGGIRISHMSELTSDRTMALTATRANRRPYTVKPLFDEPASEQSPVAPIANLLAEGDEHAERGTIPLRVFWEKRSGAEKAALGGKPKIIAWKAIAEKADKAFAEEDEDPFADQSGSSASESQRPDEAA